MNDKIVELNNEADVTIIDRMTLEQVSLVHDAMIEAFHPEGVTNEDDISARFIAIFNMFLITVGWTEDEWCDSFNQVDNEDLCDNCANAPVKINKQSN